MNRAFDELSNLCDKILDDKYKLYEENIILKQENKQLKEELEKADSITQSCIVQGKEESEISFRNCLNKLTDYKTRIDKAIEYIEKHLCNEYIEIKKLEYISKILKGEE